MKRHLLTAALFNTVMGGLSFFLIAAWGMSIIYIADTLNWIMDPTLEEGMLFAFLLIAFAVSAIYFPTLILANAGLRKGTTLSKLQYAGFAAAMLLFGLAAFYFIILNKY
jgi:hypothetical protein